MPVITDKISLQWLTEQDACNLEKCREYFGDKTEFPLTSENIRKALEAGILSSNWLARRILTGPEKDQYEKAMRPHLMIYERAMSKVLIGIIEAANAQKPVV